MQDILKIKLKAFEPTNHNADKTICWEPKRGCF